MIAYPQSLLAIGGARTGIAPVNLLDVEDVNGNLYYWSDRPIIAPPVLPGSLIPSGVSLPRAAAAGESVVWVLPSSASATGSPSADYTSMQNGGWSQSAAASVNGTGTLQKDGNDFAATDWAEVDWVFNLPVLPGRIVGIYPVLLMNGVASAFSVWPDFGWTNGPIAAAGSGAYSGQYSLDSGGHWKASPADLETVSLSSFPGFTISQRFSYSGSGKWSPADVANFVFVGLAVYYQQSGPGGSQYEPWLLSVPQFAFHRSLQTDVGNFVLQNLSGDTVSRDFEKIMRRSALEGAMFVWRLWQPDAQASWLEVHGTLTVDDIGVDTVTVKGSQLTDAARADTVECFAEGCQLSWGLKRCGSTQPTECSYSLQTCQVPERIMAAPNHYEKNYGEALASISQQAVNRQRRF